MRRPAIVACVMGLALAGCGQEQASAPTGTTDAARDVTADRMESAAKQEAAAMERVKELEALAALPDGGIDQLSRLGNIVWLPPGTDALADAIDEAGRGGIVVLMPGVHEESETVLVGERVRLLGQPGAVLEVDTEGTEDATILDPALHIQDAAGTIVWGLTIRPRGPIGGAAILVDDSRRVTVAFNTIVDHQFSVVAEQGDDIVILGNDIACSAAWQDGTVAETHGVVIINAEDAVVAGNTISDGLFGIWPCDKGGVAIGNSITGCFIGIIHCRVPEYLVMPDGTVVGAEFSATDWVTKFNHASGSFDANYIVIDGANGNVLVHNESTNPGTYDIELVGDSYRFGFLTPTSFDNVVIVGNDDYIVKDCGIDNVVVGGDLVDNDEDPCF